MVTNRHITTFYFGDDFINEWKKFQLLIKKDSTLIRLAGEQHVKGLSSVAFRELIKVYNIKNVHKLNIARNIEQHDINEIEEQEDTDNAQAH